MPSIFYGISHFDEKSVHSGQHLKPFANKLAEWIPDATHEWCYEKIGFIQKAKFNTPESVILTLPLKNSQEQYYLCGNVRIDNRDELRTTLQLPAGTLVPDEQLILAAYQRWGENCPAYLEGDFAFIIWDKKQNQLFAARDIVGYKTFYYYFSPQKCFIFGSTPYPLLQHPEIPIQLNEAALAYTHLYTLAPRDLTCCEHIKKIPPAHVLIIKPTSLTIKRYWDARAINPIHYHNKNEYYDHFLEVFERAVKLRLNSDYPITTQLSGGLDSSSVTAVAAQLLQQKSQSLVALSLVPPASQKWRSASKYWTVDDSNYIEQVADLYPNINLIKLTAAEKNILDQLHIHQKYLDAPLRNSYNRLWVELMCQHTQQMNSRTLLTGQFGNYSISHRDISGWDRQNFKQWLITRFNGMPYRFARWTKRWLQDRYFWSSYSPILPTFAKQHCPKKLHLISPFEIPVFNIADALDFLSDIGNCAVVTEAMYGVECRDPTGDKKVLEFCQAIPSSIFGDRLLVREGMRKYLPETLRQRPTQGSQSADWYAKFNAEIPLFKKVLHSLHTSENKKFLDMQCLNNLLNNWQLPDSKKDAFLGNKFIYDYEIKFLRGITNITFLSQLKQLRDRKQSLAKGKLSWDAPT